MLHIKDEETEQYVKEILFEEYSDNRFHALANLYTSDVFFFKLNAACAKMELVKFKNTFSALYSEIIRNQVEDRPLNQKLYRALYGQGLPKQNGYWSSFTSTTTNLEFAQVFLNIGDEPQTILIISLDEKKPHPHADLQSFSTHEHEMEMLILPFCPVKELRRWKKDQFEYIEVI